MSDESIHVLEQFVKAVNAGDLEAVRASFSPDVVYDDTGAGMCVTGSEAATEFLGLVLTALPDLHWEILRAHADGGTVWCEWTLTGTQTGDFPGIPASGKPVDITGASVTEVSGGRIISHRDYWNMVTYLQQVGLLPPPAA